MVLVTFSPPIRPPSDMDQLQFIVSRPLSYAVPDMLVTLLRGVLEFDHVEMILFLYDKIILLIKLFCAM